MENKNYRVYLIVRFNVNAISRNATASLSCTLSLRADIIADKKAKPEAYLFQIKFTTTFREFADASPMLGRTSHESRLTSRDICQKVTGPTAMLSRGVGGTSPMHRR